jgi:hypothetical protein
MMRARSGGFIQEPDPAFRLVDPVFQQATQTRFAFVAGLAGDTRRSML